MAGDRGGPRGRGAQVQEWANPNGKWTASWKRVCQLSVFFSERLGVEIEPSDFYVQPEGEE